MKFSKGYVLGRRKAYIGRVVTALINLAFLIAIEALILIYFFNSKYWLFGVNIPLIIGYGGALIYSLVFDIYFSCVVGNYHLEGVSQIRPHSSLMMTNTGLVFSSPNKFLAPPNQVYLDYR